MNQAGDMKIKINVTVQEQDGGREVGKQKGGSLNLVLKRKPRSRFLELDSGVCFFIGQSRF